MASFKDLSEQDRVLYIKDEFMSILESLAADPNEISNYIKVEDKPKSVVPILEVVKDNMTDEEKTELLARNKLANEKADAANLKLENEYSEKIMQFEKLKEAIVKLPKNTGCMCGTCIDIQKMNSVIPPEFELLIDFAKKTAEEKTTY